MSEAVATPVKDTDPTLTKLHVVGVDLSFTEDGKLNTFEPERETELQALTLFGWAEGIGHKGMPFLDPFPLFEGIGEENAAMISEFMTENLLPAFAQVNGVDEEILRFPILKDIAKGFDERLRHEMGYALMILSKEEVEHKVPQGFKQAMWNTGNLLLRSVGINWWTSEEENKAIEEAYEEYFQQYWGKLPDLFDSKETKNIFADEFEMVLIRLEVMKDAETIMMTADYEEMAELGHGFAYIAKHVASETEMVFGPRWISTRSTPVGASWVGIEIKREAVQLPLPEPFTG